MRSQTHHPSLSPSAKAPTHSHVSSLPLMETSAGGIAATAGLSHADYVESSLRSRAGKSWEEPSLPPPATAASCLRLMCSYGGRIVPRPSDKTLCYVCGETRMVVVDRQSSLAELSAKLSQNLLSGRSFSLKYQLPNEDLDSLISVTTDEDLDNMAEEYDRIVAASSAGAGGGATGSSRLRLFLFPSKTEMSPASSIGSLLDDSKSETWFVDALNSAMGGMGIDGLPRGLSSDSASVNCLLGLEDDSSLHSPSGATVPSCGGQDHIDRPEPLVIPRQKSSSKLARQTQDVRSIPDTAMLDTTSSFGSASSSPSLSNLPPIHTCPDDRPSDPRIAGFENSLSQTFHLAATAGQDDCKEPAYAHYLQPSPSVPLSASSAATMTISPTENPRRNFSYDDEKHDPGVISNLPQQPTKPSPCEAPIPVPGSRLLYSNATADQNRELPVSSDPSYQVPILVNGVAGYQLPQVQPEQFQQSQLHPQFHQQHPQYSSANPHFIPHPAASNVIPASSYYPIASHAIQQSVQTHTYDPQIPMYYYPVRSPATYNLVDSSSMPPPAKHAVSVPRVAVKPELAATLYRAAAASPATGASQTPLIHMAADQTHPFAGVGYHVVQHPNLSQSFATMINYGYEFGGGDRAHPQMYYSQATTAPALSPQCQSAISSVAPADAKGNRAS
ncbi:uncharacterized protein LOC122015388 [Zingiber officinale]|uniref:PB1 domain-containing protein n=1 Tax=Zingiber officinale TaxID=94328 RepID=A0A8J5F3Y5_ZINOF|nr:uncharacterized protein LOC122015388 [Zingiber officinale]KAG6481992.1 hypothetical protein ZIOFF_058616 [Zingiber officinale]